MVDKMHLKPWQWRIGAGVAAAVATAGTWTAMAYIAILGVFTQCGFDELTYEDGSAREAVCQSAVVPTIGIGALAVAAVVIAATGIAWVARRRGGLAFVAANASGLVVAAAIPLTYAAFPTT